MSTSIKFLLGVSEIPSWKEVHAHHCLRNLRDSSLMVSSHEFHKTFFTLLSKK